MRRRDLLGAGVGIAGCFLAGTRGAGAGDGRTLIVGVEELSYLPLWDGSGPRFAGLAHDILEAFAQAQGLRFVYRPLPVQRLFNALVTGEISFKMPDSPHWVSSLRAGLSINYSRPVIAYIDGIHVPAQKRGKTTLRRLATVRGFEPFPYLDRIAAGEISLERLGDTNELARFVLAGRADAAYVNTEVMRFALKRTGQPGALVHDETLLDSRGTYHLSTLREAALLETFDAWLGINETFLNHARAAHGLGPPSF